MNELQKFMYTNKEIRVVIKEGKPWFVAADVCRALELSDVNMSVRRLDDDEKGASSICTPGGNQEMITVSEPGLYSMSLAPASRKRKPSSAGSRTL